MPRGRKKGGDMEPSETSVSNGKTRRMGTPAFVGSVFMAAAVVIGGAVFVGKSDRGEIDVSAAIQNSNQANRDAGGDPSHEVNAVPEAFRNMPNGGLVPQEHQPENTPPPEVTQPTDTSTTTEGSNATGTPPEGSRSDRSPLHVL